MSVERMTPATPRELVEAVAKAIYEDRNGRGCLPWSRRPREHQAMYLSDARAALAVVRAALAEPTREMTSAAYRTEGHSRAADAIWKAMLAASPLREPEAS